MTTTTMARDEQPLWPLEAWRGLAAWLVVYAHVYPLAGVDWPLLRFAYTGVDLFFALSGFVFAPYFFERRPQLAAYAVRRLFRIYPAYAVALLIYVALKWQSGGTLDYLWQHALFAHLQSREMAFYYNPAFWSLPAEVEFYLALPLLAAWTRGGRWRVPLLLAAALALRMALGQASASRQGAAFIWLHHLPGMGVEFMFGVLAWRLAGWVEGWLQRMALVLGGLAGWLCLAALFAAWGDAGLDASPLRGQISWLAALCFAAMLAGTASAGAQAPQPLIWLAQWAGKLSYGTYLLHMAALIWVQTHVNTLGGGTAAAGLVCAMTLAGAWALHRWWEEPWRRLGRRWARHLQSPAVQ